MVLNGVAAELVVFDENGEPFTVRYHILSSLLINELQKEHARASALAEEMSELRGRLDALEAATHR